MEEINRPYQICSRGIWDTTVPGVTFDAEGVSNYARLYQKLAEAYPRGEKGKADWEAMVEKMKVAGKGKRYDCILGVSGGTDSSYLMHLLKIEYGIRPLAVTFDNGWSSDIAVRNIKKITNQLNIDLETYVMDYEEMKGIHKAYMRAGIPWIDMPTDFAIKNTLLLIAKREKIKFVLGGHDFRSEGTQPNEWTHGDSKQLSYVVRKFGHVKISSLPYLNYFSQIYLRYLKGILQVNPFYYLDYQKKKAQEFLIKNYGWDYYGGHHHENVFTKFAIACWLPQKFGIDKRIITLSAQVLNKEITREQALEQIKNPPYDPAQMELDRQYVIKKLDLTPAEFQQIWESPNKTIYDYPSYLNFINRYSKILLKVFGRFFHHKPTFFFQQEVRDKQ